MLKFARIIALLVFVFCSGLTASATVYTVTKIADTNDGTCDADCSLREAVAAANASVDNDSIEFSALFSTPQTITLTGSEIVFGSNGSLTINGTGANLLTISGNNASRIFASSANAVVNLNNLRFTAGNGVGATNSGRGGAIYNVGGTMVITNSILTGNAAANGGAINNAASASPSVNANLTIIGCVITANTSTSSGSAMQNFSTSTLHLRNTTVSGNSTTTTGIAGAFQANGTVTITNSTFSGNSAPSGTGGGVYFNGSSLIMTNTTIVNNSAGIGGGGLHRTGTNPTANVRNTIIANNTGAAGTSDVSGLVTSQGNNLIGSVGTSTGWIMSDLQNVNPMLEALAANGGLGNTHLPMAGSPALDAGQNCVVDLTCAAANPPVAITTDQRGVTRPQNGIVDIGAVEVAVAAAVTVSGQVLSPDSTPLRNVTVTISNMSGVVESARTNSFGYFTLSNIPSGQMYTLNVIAKQYSFTPQNINVTGNVTGVVITASSGNLTESK
jgi:CSLREA domain-containing protein